MIHAGNSQIKTACPYCGVGCGIIATPDADGVRIAGDPDHPANFGRLCVKGAALGDTLRLETRLLHPMIAGARASWDEAIGQVAQNFQRTIAEYGPESVAFYVSGQLLSEDYYVANKLMKGFIGAGNIDTNSRLCMSSSVAGHKRAFGADIVPNCYEDIERADVVILAGSNLAWCHPVLFQRLSAARRRRGGRPWVVNIDPRRTATSEIADLHLPLAPGSDVALFLGALRALHRAGKQDEAFTRRHTGGLAAALDVAQPWTIEKVGAQTGLSNVDLQKFFDRLIEADKTVSIYSQGVNQSWAGTDKVNAILNLHLLTGRIGKPGAGPLSATGQPNAMGGRETGGLANMLAAHMDIENPEHRALVGEFWRAPRLTQKAGLKAVDLFQAVHDGRVKALWIMATNPADSLPDSQFIARALEKCPFVVVSDVTSATTTAGFANILLPALAWGEKAGTVTNSERCVSRQRAFQPAPGEARADWRIICDVAARMGFAEHFAYRDAAEIFAEHAALSGYRNEGARDFDISAHAHISKKEYEELAPFQWPKPSVPRADGDSKRFFANGKFFTPDGRARFIATPFRDLAQSPDEATRFTLNTGRVRDQWHTMTRTGDAEKLSQHIAEPFAEIHPLDAAALGVEPAGLVRISNARGAVVLRAQITERQRLGSVFAPIHWVSQFASQAGVSALTAPIVDPVSGQPESKATPVAIEALHPAWFAFALTRRKPNLQDLDPSRGYWALARIAGGWRLELAGFKKLDDPEFFARRLFALDLDRDGDADWTAAQDDQRRVYRCVVSRKTEILGEAQTKIQGAFFMAPSPVDAARAWASQLFARAEATPLALLAARPPRVVRDPGRQICACLNVGVNAVRDAILERTLRDADSVSEATGAGTGCGSCKPEIARLLAACIAAQAEPLCA